MGSINCPDCDKEIISEELDKLRMQLQAYKKLEDARDRVEEKITKQV